MKQPSWHVFTCFLLVYIHAILPAEHPTHTFRSNTYAQLTPTPSHAAIYANAYVSSFTVIAWSLYQWLTHDNLKEGACQSSAQQHAQSCSTNRYEAQSALLNGADDVYTRHYSLDCATRDFLRVHTLDDRCYVTCTGNVMQHALHEECITLAANTAHLDVALSAYQDMLAHAIDAGRMCAHANDTAASMRMLDWAHTLYQYAYAIAQGIMQGAEQTVDTLAHPRQLLAQLSHSSHEIVCCTLRVLHECGLIETLIDIDNDALLDAYITNRSAYVHEISRHITHYAQELTKPDGVRAAVASTTHMLLTGKCLHAIGKLFNFAARSAPYVHKHIGDFALRDQCSVALAADAFLVDAAQEVAQLALHAAQVASPATKVLAVIAAYEPPAVCIERLGKKFPQWATDECKPLIHVLKGEVTSQGKLLGLHHDHLGYLEAQGKIRVLEVYENGMYKAEVFYNGKWKEKGFFPKNWSCEQVICEINKKIEQPNIWRIEGNRRTVEVVMAGRDVRIVLEMDGRIVTAYPII